MATVALTITALSQRELEEEVHALSKRFKGADAPAEQAGSPAPKPRGRPKAAAAAPEAEGQVPAADDQGAAAEPGPLGSSDAGDAGEGDMGRGGGEPAPAVVTFDDIKAASRELAKAKSVDAVVKVLADFGAAKPQDLKEEDFPKVLTALREAA